MISVQVLQRVIIDSSSAVAAALIRVTPDLTVQTVKSGCVLNHRNCTLPASCVTHNGQVSENNLCAAGFGKAAPGK